MPPYNQLDFRLLPTLESAPMFVSLGQPIENAMAVLPDTWARADAALRFCWHVSQDAEQLHAQEPRATRLREAFLRACLTEYRAMDEVLPRDLASLNINARPLKIHDLKNPLVHVMKELRNFEIHLASSELTPNTIPVIARFHDREMDHENTVWVTEPLTVAKFNMLQNASRYDPGDIQRLVDWFNDAQKQCGVHYLAYLAIKAFCDELITQYNLQPTHGT